MKNFKQCVSLILAVILTTMCLVSNRITVNAANNSFKNEDKAKVLYNMDLFKGVSDTTFEPDLGAKLTREQGFVMIIRLIGKETDAEALKEEQTDAALNAFLDGNKVSPVFKKAIAYAVINGLVKGDGANLIPQGSLSGKDFATLILRNLGYSDKEFSYDTACTVLADKNGCTPSEAMILNDKVLIRDDVVGLSYSSLNAVNKDGSKLIDKLISVKPKLKEIAVKSGFLINEETTEIPSSTPDATSATPSVGGNSRSNNKNSTELLNSNVIGASKIELTFNKNIDITKASINIKNNDADVEIFKISSSDDYRKIIIETANKIVQGQYNITINGLTKIPITASIKTFDEKVSNIKYLNNKAYIDEDNDRKLHVYYTIYNQYKEDVTSSVYSSENLKFLTGYDFYINGVNEVIINKPEFLGLEGFKLGEKLPISFIYFENYEDALINYYSSDTLSIVYKEASVDFIPILPETVINNVFDPTGKSVIAKLKIYNKYYDDVTSLYKNDPNVVISTNRGVASPLDEDGKFIITSDNFFNNYDTVEISVYNKAQSGNAIKSTYVREGYMINKIDIKSIYNKDNLELNSDNLATSDFYLVLDVKDEYGRTVTDATYLNENLKYFSSRITTIDVDSIIENMDINGQNEAVIHIKKSNNYLGGNATVIIHNVANTTRTFYIVKVKGKRVNDFIIKGIYNKDNLALNTDNLATDDFYLVLEVKDDYGRTVTDAVYINSELIYVSSNIATINVEKELKNININGKTESVITIKKSNNYIAGSALITVVSRFSGKLAQYEVNVAEASKVDTISLDATSSAYIGEEVVIPYKAIDQYGNEVTDLNKLNSISLRTSDSSAGLKFRKNETTGNVELILDLKNTIKTGELLITALTPTYKTSIKTIDIKNK